MNHSLRSIQLFTLLAIGLVSCTIEKRIHRNGWHVNWNNRLPGKIANQGISTACTDSIQSSTEVFPVEKEDRSSNIKIRNYSGVVDTGHIKPPEVIAQSGDRAKPRQLQEIRPSPAFQPLSDAYSGHKQNIAPRTFRLTVWHTAGALFVLVAAISALSGVYIGASIVVGLFLTGVFLVIYGLIYLLGSLFKSRREIRNTKRQIREEKRQLELEKLRAEREKLRNENPGLAKEPEPVNRELQNAWIALVFSILGIFPLLFIGGIIGLVFANPVIKNNQGLNKNEKALRIAKIAKAISITSFFLGLAGLIFGIILAASFSGGFGG